jgi:hypothetical protein
LVARSKPMCNHALHIRRGGRCSSQPMNGRTAMTTVAHINGVPFEEWLALVATSASGITLALGAAARRLVRRQAGHSDDLGTAGH